MEHFTFEQLPQALRLLHEKMNRIERLLVEQQPPQERELLLNVSQAAAFLHLSVATLYTKVSGREVPFSKRGKRLYFRKSELEEWVREGRRKTVSEIRQEAVQKAGNNGRKR
ncbi:helix-turn-helix domain-containing protein [Pontibacter qinzhouensis]|uniref:Helix-turn-helix domain-containing protein n=1 Tax=Pontibacter qinzhouensis TaxID=2603253 RepID=A0A5C8J446_9BACT|nr:helix-turn-helix domain-containing protein [Pontibacter qinzhouensis]TXK29852.1 helix-turn-helix domain-containing protein [Pontibacter qinzhouensis]